MTLRVGEGNTSTSRFGEMDQTEFSRNSANQTTESDNRRLKIEEDSMSLEFSFCFGIFNYRSEDDSIAYG